MKQNENNERVKKPNFGATTGANVNEIKLKASEKDDNK